MYSKGRIRTRKAGTKIMTVRINVKIIPSVIPLRCDTEGGWDSELRLEETVVSCEYMSGPAAWELGEELRSLTVRSQLATKCYMGLGIVRSLVNTVMNLRIP
jgi:hypothetical protein